MAGESSYLAVSAILVAGLCSPLNTAAAQTARSSLVASAQPPAGPSDEPSFRDPKTGQVWTPNNVSQDGKPVAPDERAFDPNGQAVRARIAVQDAKTAHVGTVPVLAGPTVPLVELGHADLRVRPGRKWRVTLYLQNNSGSTLAPVLSCQFTNAGKIVMRSEVLIPATAGGERVGVFFTGPASEDYVDLVRCDVLSP